MDSGHPGSVPHSGAGATPAGRRLSSLGPMRLLPRARVSRSLACLAGVALILGACGDGEPAATAVPTPEIRSPTLLPTPTEAPAAASAGSDDSAVPPAASTPTPSPPSLACLSQRQRFAQLFVPLATQAELTSSAVPLAAAGDLGGIGLLGFPDEGLAAALAEIQNASMVPVLVASDEEGGDVQRLGVLLGPLPSAATAASTRSPEEVRLAWVEYGSRLKDLGIDVVFGPVLDVGAAPGIGNRSFGDDPVVVTDYGRAVADGLTEAGVVPVFKHFPGHGRASVDSHLGLPLVPSIDELWASDLIPYVELVGDHRRDDAAVMVGHLSVPGLSGDLPTSLSAETINGLLKTQIGFDGLVFTDAINMGAILENFGTLDAVVRAFNAGADIVILGSLADVAPALDHLIVEAAADPGFEALLELRAVRVLEAKDQTDICVGAQ